MTVGSVSSHSALKPVAAVHMAEIKALAKQVSVARQSMNTLMAKLEGPRNCFHQASHENVVDLRNTCKPLYDKIDELTSKIKESTYKHSPKKLEMLNKLDMKVSKTSTKALKTVQGKLKSESWSRNREESASANQKQRHQDVRNRKEQIATSGFDANYNGGMVK